MTDERKAEQSDETIEDLDVGTEESSEVKGGTTNRKAGKGQQEYLQVKLSDVLISS